MYYIKKLVEQVSEDIPSDVKIALKQISNTPLPESIIKKLTELLTGQNNIKKSATINQVIEKYNESDGAAGAAGAAGAIAISVLEGGNRKEKPKK